MRCECPIIGEFALIILPLLNKNNFSPLVVLYFDGYNVSNNIISIISIITKIGTFNYQKSMLYFRIRDRNQFTYIIVMVI